MEEMTIVVNNNEEVEEEEVRRNCGATQRIIGDETVAMEKFNSKSLLDDDVDEVNKLDRPQHHDDLTTDMTETLQFPEKETTLLQVPVVQLDHVSSSAAISFLGDERTSCEEAMEAATITTVKLNVNNEEGGPEKCEGEVSKKNKEEEDSSIIFGEDGIGHLPGSDLKFQMNEFGLVEIMDNEASQLMYNQAKLTSKETVLTNGVNHTEKNESDETDHMMDVGPAVPEKLDCQTIGAFGNEGVEERSGDAGVSIPLSNTDGKNSLFSEHTTTTTTMESVTTEVDDKSGLGVIENEAALPANSGDISSQTKDINLEAVQADSGLVADMESQRMELDEPFTMDSATGQLTGDEPTAAHPDLPNGHVHKTEENDGKRDPEMEGIMSDGAIRPNVEIEASADDIKLEVAGGGNVEKMEISTDSSSDAKENVEETLIVKSDPDPKSPSLQESSTETEHVAVDTRDESQPERDCDSISKELIDPDKISSGSTEERDNNSRTPSPVFHLPPPPIITSNGKQHTSSPPKPVNGDAVEEEDSSQEQLVFCKCCGCFGLQEEFYQSTFCTKACGDSYKYQTKSPDGRFRRPMPVTPKKCKVLPAEFLENGSSDCSYDSKGSPGERNSVSPSDKGKRKKQKSPPVSKGKLNLSKSKTSKAAGETETGGEKVKNRRISATKNLKDRKRNFPALLSKRMPTSPEKKLFPESITKEVQLSPDITQVRTKHFPVRSASGSSEFDWKKYLADTNSKSAPHRLFRQPAMPPENPFKSGWMLESIDPQHQSLICVTTVVETQGYRLRLRFQGFSEAYDYWVNADSLDIFPAGWCEENNLELQPPPGESEPFNWHQYLVKNQLEAAPRHIFAISKEDFTGESGVRSGMKLEAVDIRNQNLVCVATVAKVMGERILVHFDSWDSLYDYWTDLTSPYIHPVGWCDKNDVRLTPPNNVKREFSWDQYLDDTHTSPLPARLFRPLPPVGFKKGMKVECVDKRNPFLIRLGTIADVDKHNLVIHFDNWPSIYDYAVYELSPDIHPVGWCAHTGHPLQPPPPADGSWKGACTVFGCIGLGHIKGPKFLTHNSEKNCPYALHNYKKDLAPADRVIVFERSCTGQDNSPSLEVLPKAEAKVSGLVGLAQAKTSNKGSSVNAKSASVKRKRSSTSSNKEYNAKRPKSRATSPKSQTTSLPSRSPSPPAISRESISGDEEVHVKMEIKQEEEIDDAPLPKLEEAPSVTQATNSSGDGETGSSRKSSTRSSSTSSSSSVSQAASKTTEPTPKLGQMVKKEVVVVKKEKNTDEACTNIPVASSSSSSVTPLASTGASSSTETDAEFPSNYGLHSSPLKAVVGDVTEAAVNDWKVEELASFIAKIRGCEHTSNAFLDQLIDGESFLMLSQADFMKVLGLKMGPAIKLTNVIKLIKCNSLSSKLRGS